MFSFVFSLKRTPVCKICLSGGCSVFSLKKPPVCNMCLSGGCSVLDSFVYFYRYCLGDGLMDTIQNIITRCGTWFVYSCYFIGVMRG